MTDKTYQLRAPIGDIKQRLRFAKKTLKVLQDEQVDQIKIGTAEVYGPTCILIEFSTPGLLPEKIRERLAVLVEKFCPDADIREDFFDMTVHSYQSMKQERKLKAREDVLREIKIDMQADMDGMAAAIRIFEDRYGAEVPF